MLLFILLLNLVEVVGGVCILPEKWKCRYSIILRIVLKIKFRKGGGEGKRQKHKKASSETPSQAYIKSKHTCSIHVQYVHALGGLIQT